MFVCLLLTAAAHDHFDLNQVLWPEASDEQGLFGRSVAFARGRIAVGASMFRSSSHVHQNKPQIGAVYPYQLHYGTGLFQAASGTTASSRRIEPPYQEHLVPGSFGATITLSEDGSVMVVGAPTTDVAQGYAAFEIRDSDFDPSNDTITYPGTKVTYYASLGAVYVFRRNADGLWENWNVSVPLAVVGRGGYGRTLAGTPDLSLFSAGYYNSLDGTPKKVGKVFVEEVLKSGLRQYPVIDPPATITNPNTQRFGSVLALHGDERLYITSQSQGSDTSGVFLYSRTGGTWTKTEEIRTENECQQSAVLDNTFVAIYGSNTSQIVVLKSEPSGWPARPHQVIDLGRGKDEQPGLHFCSDYLAVTLTSAKLVYIYRRDKATDKFLFFQNISDPGTVRQDVSTPYSEQHVQFGSDLAWEPQCRKFAVGAMARTDGDVPLSYGRVYVYQFVEDVPEEKRLHPAIVAVAVVLALSAMTAIVILLERLRRKTVEYRNLSDEARIEDIASVTAE